MSEIPPIVVVALLAVFALVACAAFVVRRMAARPAPKARRVVFIDDLPVQLQWGGSVVDAETQRGVRALLMSDVGIRALEAAAGSPDEEQHRLDGIRYRNTPSFPTCDGKREGAELSPADGPLARLRIRVAWTVKPHGSCVDVVLRRVYLDGLQDDA